MILITNPEKPLLRTPKGSIQKKATIKAYGVEIDALYVLSSSCLRTVRLQGFLIRNRYTAAETTSQFAGPSVWTATVLEGWLTERANAITRGHSMNASTDLFAQGFDRYALQTSRHVWP